MKSTKFIVKVAVLSAVAFVLELIGFSVLPAFPWLKMDFSDTAALFAGFSMGPLAGALVVIMKNLLHLAFSDTMFVGELANILMGLAFVLPATIIYTWKKHRKSAYIGMGVGMIFEIGVAMLANWFILVPLFYPAMAFTESGLQYLIAGVLPFNAIKCALLILVSALLYKRLSPILHR